MAAMAKTLSLICLIFVLFQISEQQNCPNSGCQVRCVPCCPNPPPSNPPPPSRPNCAPFEKAVLKCLGVATKDEGCDQIDTVLNPPNNAVGACIRQLQGLRTHPLVYMVWYTREKGTGDEIIGGCIPSIDCAILYRGYCRAIKYDLTPSRDLTKAQCETICPADTECERYGDATLN